MRSCHIAAADRYYCIGRCCIFCLVVSRVTERASVREEHALGQDILWFASVFFWAALVGRKNIYRLLATALMCSCMNTFLGCISFAADQRLLCQFAQIFYLGSAFYFSHEHMQDLFMKAKPLRIIDRRF